MRACVVLFLSSLALWAVPSFAEDDGTAEAPPPPAIPVSARASVTPSSCRVGGTVTYALETAWSAPPGRFVLPAPVEAPLAQGLDLRTRSEKSSKAAGAGGDESRHTMTAVYACVEPGSFALGPVTVKYEDGGGTTGKRLPRP
ncbi:MAG: hypothetical protein M5R36_08570 [Deltaproteobacteria bacterium]|nr:hypothetical protein [Deltaproteobacteria bacterium]